VIENADALPRWPGNLGGVPFPPSALVILAALPLSPVAAEIQDRIPADSWQSVASDSTREKRWHLEFALPAKEELPDVAVIEVVLTPADGSTGTGLVELYENSGDGEVFQAAAVLDLTKARSLRISVTRCIEEALRKKKNRLSFDLVTKFREGLSPVDFSAKSIPELKMARAHRSASILGPLVPEAAGGRVLAETVMPLGQAEDGVFCPLLFAPSKIESVFHPMTGGVFEENQDYRLEPGGLRILPGGRIQTVPESELFANPPGKRAYRLRDGRWQITPEGQWWNRRQISVTYQTKESVGREAPPSSLEAHRDALKRFRTRLENRKPSRILIFGDSISVGANASGKTGVAPFLSPWIELVVDSCREAYQVPIELRNHALGGTRSDWGRMMAPALLGEYPADLVVVAFGMNDRGRTSLPEFRANIEAIIREARSANPEVDILLVSSMQPNPQIADSKPLNEYKKVLQELTGSGIALADMTEVSEYLLKRKRFIDLTGNGINHPNDYLIRWYAKTVGQLLLPE
jgi:lysophospholipase L1-like esterase